MAQKHTLVVQLNDRPGALYRAIGLIRRRDYNVSSLFVSATDGSGTSRMIIVVEANNVHQIAQQLTRLIDVLSVSEVPHDDAVLSNFASMMRQFDCPSTATTAQELVS